MTEAEFEELLQRYLDGTSRPGERELVEQWSSQLGQPENLLLPQAERAHVRAAMWQQIERRTQGANDSGHVLPLPASRWWPPVVRGLAAALLVLGVALAVVGPRRWQPVPAATASHWVQYRNTGQQPQTLILADRSRVTLYPQSSIRYRPRLAGARREVKLQGEAFFKVAKNPGRPFLVYTHQLVTTVLGTSFRVKAYGGQSNEVAVEEGRVSVQVRRGAQLNATPAQPAPAGVVLRPNQQVTYAALAMRPLRKKLVANPLVLSPQVFTFEKQPVSRVLEALEKAYGVDIVYDRARLAACTITITFYQESLYEKLEVLSQALGASYSTDDEEARILFRSDGCTS